MADVNQPTLSLIASGTVDYVPTPHHPTLSLTASGTVDYTKSPNTPALSLTASATVAYTATPPGWKVTGVSEIVVTTGGQMNVVVNPIEPPAGIDPKVDAVTSDSDIPFTLDRFGKPT